MPKKYERTPLVRFFNWLMSGLLHLGLGPERTYLLTVRGRKTGRRYTTPVSIIDEDETRYLVSPYGEVSWVKNARANCEVTLSRGTDSQSYGIVELPADQAAPILKTYLQREAITRPYFEVDVDSSLEEFASEASEHPVFRLEPK